MGLVDCLLGLWFSVSGAGFVALGWLATWVGGVPFGLGSMWCFRLCCYGLCLTSRDCVNSVVVLVSWR